jgi:hypothetical protein
MDTEISVLDSDMTPSLQLRRRQVLDKFLVLVQRLHVDVQT